MVVAAGAVGGEAEECLGDYADHLFELILADGFAFLLDGRGESDGVGGAEDEGAGGDDGVAIIGFEDVAGDLFAGEFEIRLVGVEAADDVVPIGPGVFAGFVAFEAFAFGEADDVEPVAGPAFAVVGAF